MLAMNLAEQEALLRPLFQDEGGVIPPGLQIHWDPQQLFFLKSDLLSYYSVFFK